MLLTDLLEDHASRWPDRAAARDARQAVSYAELLQRVRRTQAWLVVAGMRQGDRIAMLSTPSIDYYVCLLAVTGLGGIWVGLNPRHTPHELAYAISDAEPRIVLHLERLDDRDYGAEFEATARRHPATRFVSLAHGLPQSSIGAAPSDIGRTGGGAAAVIVYTSGSTGQPKGAQLSHEALILGSRAMLRRWGVDCVNLINFFPINHIACTGDVTVTGLVAGGTLTFQPRFMPEEILTAIDKGHASVLFVIPTMLNLLMRDPAFRLATLKRLALIAWGGAPLQQHVIETLLAAGLRLAGCYGMTEAAANTTWTPPDADASSLANTVGKPLPEYPTRIRAHGEHQVSFSRLGYWRRPEATAEVTTTDGWYRTGDVGVWDADGCIRIVGRARHMFKSGGYNIYPREIEVALEEHPDVDEAIVVSVPDAVFHEIGVAFIRMSSDGAVSHAELKAYARSRLANYKVPKLFVLRTSLPLLAVGKVDRARLAQEARDLRVSEATS